MDIWEKSSIPYSSSLTSMARRISDFYEISQRIKKTSSAKRTSQSFQQQSSDYRSDCMKLFDIARCKCPCLITCCCLPTDRVPIQEHSFLLDQRDKRLMFIGPIDHKYTIRCQKSCARASIKTSSQQFATSSTAMFSPKTETLF